MVLRVIKTIMKGRYTTKRYSRVRGSIGGMGREGKRRKIKPFVSPGLYILITNT